MSRSVDLAYDELEILNQLAEFYRKMSTIELLRTEMMMHEYHGIQRSDRSVQLIFQLILKTIRDEIERRLP